MTYLILLIVFEAKHFLGDWIFQTSWMSNGKRLPWTPLSGWLAPLSAHCGIHALITMIILSVISLGFPEIISLLWIVALDFGTHFLMDRTKGYTDLLWQFSSHPVMFWVMLVIDQTVHHSMNLFAVYKIGQFLTK